MAFAASSTVLHSLSKPAHYVTHLAASTFNHGGAERSVVASVGSDLVIKIYSLDAVYVLFF